MKKEYRQKLKMVFNMAKAYMNRNTDNPYHNFRHAIDVAYRVSVHCRNEGMSEKDKFLGVSAALAHDMINRPGYQFNEEDTSMLVSGMLGYLGYGMHDSLAVGRIIISTKVPQKPKTKLEQIVCDADMDNLGRSDFFEKGELVRQEVGASKGKGWYQSMLDLMKSHAYFTDSARQMRNEGKRGNMHVLEQMITACEA